jgi:isoleucyl-tRNA synthetase
MAYDVMYYTLQTILKCLNGFTPFLAEKLHRDFLMRFQNNLPESINLTDMPEVEKAFLDMNTENAFDILQELRSSSSHARNKKGVKLRHPVAKITLIATSMEVVESAKSLKSLLLNDLNTIDFEVLETDVMADFVQLSIKPDYKVMGPKFKDKMKDLVDALQETDAAKLRADLEKHGTAEVEVNGKKLKIEQGDVHFEETLPEHLSHADSRVGRVYVDITRTRELEAVGLVRDVTRRVQVMRKEIDLIVDQSIEVLIRFSESESVELAEMHRDYLAAETRASSLELVGPKSKPKWSTYDYAKEWEIDDLTIKVGMNPK